MEKLRLACATDPQTFLLRSKVAGALGKNFEIFYSSIDRSQKKVLKSHNPDAIFIDCEMINQEQCAELKGFLRMINKHFPRTKVIIRAPIIDLKNRNYLKEISPKNV